MFEVKVEGGDLLVKVLAPPRLMVVSPIIDCDLHPVVPGDCRR